MFALFSAYDFLEQAENFLRLRQFKQLMEVLGKVNTSATYAFRSSETNKVDDLVMAVKLLILVDVFSQSFAASKDGGIELVPINSLEREKRGNMVVHVTSHLKRLVKRMKKKSLPTDGLRKVLTLNYQSIEDGKVHETLDMCVQWIDPRAKIVDEDTIKITLPPLNLIPESEYGKITWDIPEAKANMNLSFLGVDGSTKHAISLYIEERQPGKDGGKYLNIGYFGIIYTLTLRQDDGKWGSRKYVEDDEMIDVTIKGNEITSTSTDGTFEPLKDMTKIESAQNWTPRDIRSLAPSVMSGDVTSVKYLTLHTDIPFYSMEDMSEALKIVKVAKSLYVTAPVVKYGGMGCWQDLADTAAGLEKLFIVGVYDTWDDYNMYEFGEGHEEQVGRLVTRAKETTILSVEFSNFTLFCQAVAGGLAEEGNICEEIRFKWSSRTNKQDEVQKLREMIGWKEKENPDKKYNAVIVK